MNVLPMIEYTVNISVDEFGNLTNISGIPEYSYYVISYDQKDCVYYFYLPFSGTIFHKFMEKNWETIKKTNSYFVFLFEDTYDFQRYLGKKPIYDYAELVIYSLKD